MIIKGYFNLKLSFLQGVVLTALVAGYFYVPGINAAIDDAMPGNIPSQIKADWQDQGGDAASIKASLPEEYQAKCDGSFESACHWRRVYRMSQFPCLENILFTRGHNMGSIAVGFWVNIGSGGSAVSDDNFAAKGALCLQKFENYYSTYKEILTKTNAFIRDPCISLDGKKVVFAMSGDRKGTGYRLFEMEIDNPGSVKQLTENPAGLTIADFEPCYLPNGDIMFSSTRCFGVIDCGWQATTNLFLMNGEGEYIRRVGYDQVHTTTPTLRGDGTVLYSRWEYNDRDIANIMGLFQVNPDGCRQTEVFGNQTTWPMTMVQGRAVPGNPNKFFAVASGHHGAYSGEVFVCDNSEDSNGPEHIQMISPVRETKTLNNRDTDAMGGVNRNSEYPYPLNEEWYLVGYRDKGQEGFGRVSNDPYSIYLKHVDGKQRELLAWGDNLHHPVVVAPWKDIWGEEPFPVAEQANFNETTGTFTMEDVYFGQGMEGIDKAKGEAKTLRVVALKYRVSGACNSGESGMAMGGKPSGVIFAAPNITPPSLWGASWDVKYVLGEAKIYEDGSAAFKVPAREPVYFQVLDERGRAIATMRSWATLMPGETFACYGCHENKASAPPIPPNSDALTAGVQELDKTLGIEDEGFDYPAMVQPILDAHCASCHKANHTSGFDLSPGLTYNSSIRSNFAKSYSSLMKGIGAQTSNKAISIYSIFSVAEQYPPRAAGSTKSGMIDNVWDGHHDVNLTEKEKRILACWIDLEAVHSPSYDAYMNDSDKRRYQALEADAQKWYDIEAKNVKAYADIQTALNPDLAKSASTITECLRIGYQPLLRTLVLNKVSRGNFMLVDLRGRTVSRMKLSHQNTDNISIRLPASLGTGLYLARFEGADGKIQQAKISITQ